ncbi:hypothetical protein CALCODRAFT_225689 [Calocera cornea HHB12733]|uniref:Uncharacterized protein n=1 Tax=Calocera cornea HHB12733 TaxID=1353952 RepID=A0A165C0Z1_9BASI|nr:hypothetical protein CALCODRAFT_225689 [Calocera cornea HHB12733]
MVGREKVSEIDIGGLAACFSPWHNKGNERPWWEIAATIEVPGSACRHQAFPVQEREAYPTSPANSSAHANAFGRKERLHGPRSLMPSVLKNTITDPRSART